MSQAQSRRTARRQRASIKKGVEKYYELDPEVIGTGGFAVFRRAKPREPRTVASEQFGEACRVPDAVAIKIIDKTAAGNLAFLKAEVAIMKSIDHPYCVKLFEVIDEPRKMCLVLELVSGGELFDRLIQKGSYTEGDAAQVMLQLSKALRYLHKRNIVHRDIKPENLLYASPADDAQLKLADFGLAQVTTPNAVTDMAGTAEYFAPEVLNKWPQAVVGSADLWSVGVILYLLLSGTPPFDGDKPTKQLFDDIKDGRYDMERDPWPSVSVEAKAVVRRLLELDPTARLTAAQMAHVPWVEGAERLPRAWSRSVSRGLERHAPAEALQPPGWLERLGAALVCCSGGAPPQYRAVDPSAFAALKKNQKARKLKRLAKARRPRPRPAHFSHSPVSCAKVGSPRKTVRLSTRARMLRQAMVARRRLDQKMGLQRDDGGNGRDRVKSGCQDFPTAAGSDSAESVLPPPSRWALSTVTGHGERVEGSFKMGAKAEPKRGIRSAAAEKSMPVPNLILRRKNSKVIPIGIAEFNGEEPDSPGGLSSCSDSLVV